MSDRHSARNRAEIMAAKRSLESLAKQERVLQEALRSNVGVAPRQRAPQRCHVCHLLKGDPWHRPSEEKPCIPCPLEDASCGFDKGHPKFLLQKKLDVVLAKKEAVMSKVQAENAKRDEKAKKAAFKTAHGLRGAPAALTALAMAGMKPGAVGSPMALNNVIQQLRINQEFNTIKAEDLKKVIGSDQSFSDLLKRTNDANMSPHPQPRKKQKVEKENHKPEVIAIDDDDAEESDERVIVASHQAKATKSQARPVAAAAAAAAASESDDFKADCARILAALEGKEAKQRAEAGAVPSLERMPSHSIPSGVPGSAADAKPLIPWSAEELKHNTVLLAALRQQLAAVDHATVNVAVSVRGTASAGSRALR